MNRPKRSDSSPVVTNVHITADMASSAIESLESYFQVGGVSIVQAAFAHTYFVHPDRVREKTPYFPDRARRSRKHYPGLEKGREAEWQGKPVTLDDNQYAQIAWERYTGHKLARGSGYGIRHIWGNPWDPDLFTAGWNICYMPFWAGMLTERQHPYPDLEKAIRQASWDLYFRDSPVCQLPDFVESPGLNLDSILNGRPILVLNGEPPGATRTQNERPRGFDSDEDVFQAVKQIRTQTHQSWVNILKASKSLQGEASVAFGTRNVENSAKSCVRRIHRETGLSVVEIENLMDQHGLG